ncbi:hypothetical protein ABT235_27560 [Micromonospora echinofusca]|uniref:hypothetical protein n=1 Tax=Micromonospora echinofusca TaxID=47858 RepID=UPI000CBEAAD3|nr:hypothetical protein [Micromonospora sp. MSM11]MCL7455879.1 hypothetical protein [Micromonospora sp. MSM11]
MDRRFVGQWPTGPQPYVPTVMQLTVEVESDGGLARSLLREWFEAGLRILAASLVGNSRSGADHGHSLEGWTGAAMFITPFEGRAELRQEYSPESWQGFLDALIRLPSFASFEAQQLGPQGVPSFPSTVVSCERVDGDRAWLNLSMVTKPQLRRSGKRWGEALSFLREMAEKVNPSYGGISFLDTVFSSPLEAQLHLRSRDTVPISRSRLRGYGWITILPEEVGVRLGGVAGLRASGAFAEVAALENGGFWLRATEDLDNYRAQQAELVRSALAVVLPNAGMVETR